MSNVIVCVKMPLVFRRFWLLLSPRKNNIKFRVKLVQLKSSFLMSNAP
jgi:hypothetical protein